MAGEDSVEIRIESLAAGGDGVGRLPDGRAVFVPFTAPGDRARVRIVEDHPRFARAELDKLVEPGPGRCDPACPVFGTCGGCSWQHVGYPEQLAAKAAILRDALRRIGHFDVPDEIRITPSPMPYRYRTRTRVHVEGERVGYRRRRSREICSIAGCPVLVETLDLALAALAGDAETPPHDVELALGDDGRARATALPVRRGAPAFHRVGAFRLRVSPGVFHQSNAALVDVLADAVCSAAEPAGRVLELFAGAGALTLPLAARFPEVTAVESHPAAVRDLRSNLRAAALDRVEVVLGRAEEVVRDRPGDPPDVVVLDPPRTGLAPGGARALAELGAPRVVYLSCDPATLARDAAQLAQAGYCLEAVQAFDLFPQTPHVEALAVLERGA
ncbi:MAG: class I SAM-dependent RNA methyltransferase [Proteobacteria bacterium]|nr:class I SAM-dependent RNA methyltransferase [Pseudomonadota bacterium]